MRNFPPNISPRMQTLSAMIVGYFLIDGFTANEQNAIGNWFMLVGQILETNAGFQQVSEEKMQKSTMNTKEFLNTLEQAINKMQNEIDKIKKDII